MFVCFAPLVLPMIIIVVCAHLITSHIHSIHKPKPNCSDNNESEYFSEQLAAESLPHYQQAPTPVKKTPSPTTSPYSSVDATNHVNNNGQQYQPPLPVQTQQNNMINNNPKYHQPPTYNNNNGNGQPTNGNGQPLLVRNNVVMSASIPAGGVSANAAIQQQLQQKYYDQYENYAKPTNGNGVSNGANNNHHQNGMSQSVYNGTKAYGAPPPQQMTSSYNQQLAYNNHYNNQQNGSGVGKIADYDPLTDGPRNVPQTTRTNQTLIYSSDRAAREFPSDFIIFLSSFCPSRTSKHICNA